MIDAVQATTTLLQGNFVGTNVAGNAAIGNGADVVFIDNASDNSGGGMPGDATGCLWSCIRLGCPAPDARYNHGRHLALGAT
jgi:hypothetical protein